MNTRVKKAIYTCSLNTLSLFCYKKKRSVQVHLYVCKALFTLSRISVPASLRTVWTPGPTGTTPYRRRQAPH